MTHVITRARKAGGSLILTIPKDVRQSLGIEEDQLVEIDIRSPRVDFFGAIPKINPYTQNAR
jgi:bifunctional DNA-binding transcriptional regulator/antitoxin component of YhaV-PrlF toxin-antitoxin module